MSERIFIPQFSPARIPGLLAWFDADAIVGLNDGDAVETWLDSGLLGNDLSQSTVANRPTYQAGERNSHPVVRFDGSNDYMEAASSLFSGSEPRSIVVVYNHSSTSSVQSIAGQGGDGAGSAGGSWFIIQNRGTPLGDPYFAGYADDLTGPALDPVWKIAYIDYDGTTVRMYKNGGLENSGAKALNSDSDFLFRLGNSNDVSLQEHLNGDIGEVCVVNHALTVQEFENLHVYWADKWAVTLA